MEIYQEGKMKKILFCLIISPILFSENIEVEKIFENFYIKPLPYNFKYNKNDNSIYWLIKEKDVFFESFSLRDKEIKRIELKEIGKIFSFEIIEDYFFFFTENGIFKTNDFKEFEKILDMSFGKFSKNGNFISYTKGYNLYIFSLKEKKEIKVTDDGEKSKFYGKVDWVYEEELNLKEGFKFSDDEKYLAFLCFDEGGVLNFPLINYESPIPSIEYIFYPKAGSKNPFVSLWIYDIEKNKKEFLYAFDSENYIVFYTFTPDSKSIIFATMPRSQKKLIFYDLNIKTKEIKKIYQEDSLTWVNFLGDPIFINKEEFLFLSEKEGFSKPYIISKNGDIKKFKFEKILEKIVDFEERYFYFIEISPNPLKRKFKKFSILDGSEKDLFKKEGFLNAQKIENSPFVLIYYSSFNRPNILYLFNREDESIIEIFNSAKEEYYKLELADFEFIKIKDLYGILLKPKNFKKDKKYPLVLYVYGGPHAQVVSERFGGSTFLFHNYLVSKGFLVFSLDNRGSYGRGKNWEEHLHRQFGKVELEDQLKGIEYLKSLGFIDEERIGIWGWSYGGFMVLYAMTHTDIFKAGFSIAPVVDWKLYDTIYTERYLGLPEENEEGYFNSSPINFAKNLKGNLFLVHGTLDDNVHFQNTVNFINELIKEEKKFKLMIYPNRDHSIRDEKARIHLFREIYNFFEEELLK